MSKDSICTQLRKVRMQRKVTQATVALRAGLSRVAYSKIETEKSDPVLSSLTAICDALSLDLLVVPKSLRADLELFIASGGRYLERTPGLAAPKSRVDSGE